MADLAITITKSNIFAALRAFITGIVSCEVFQNQDNRVAMPKTDFIALNVESSERVSTNRRAYGTSAETITTPTIFYIRVDCYGAGAQARAQSIAALWRDDYAYQAIRASGFDMAPLYADDPQQIPLMTGENQLLERWTCVLALQVNHAVTVNQQTANALSVTLNPLP